MLDQKKGKLRKLLYVFTPKQRRQLTILGVLLFIGMIFEMIGLGILIPALGVMLNSDIANQYPSIRPLLKYIGNPSQLQLVIYGMIIMVMVYIVKGIFLSYLSWRQSSFSSFLAADLTYRLFRGYLYQPYSFHLNRNSSELIRNMQTEIGQFTSLSQSIIALTIESSVIIGSAIMLIIIEPFGALSVGFFLLVFSIAFHRLTESKLLIWGEQRQFNDGKITLHLMQGLGAVKDVKIYGKENFFLFHFNIYNYSKAKIFAKQVTLNQIPRLYLELLSIIAFAGLIIMMVMQNKPLNLLLPVIGVFAAAAFRMLPSVSRIMGAVQNIRFTQPVVDVLYKEFKIISNEKLEENFSKKISFENEIFIKNLNFTYSSASKKAINNISLKIGKNETVGFIGPSGSGKSTLIDLILGLLTPDMGEICVDSENIRENIRSWQNEIGYVPQTIYLIDDSILKNVAFGIPDDKIDNEAVERAIKSAQLDELVLSLPDGLNTFVGERGVRLSGGQRQRIGIARALYNDPAILVLDEATSSLDSNTEMEVMNSVSALQGKKTLLIVAHRLSTVEKCDRLYKLQNGVLMEQCSHEILSQ